MRGTRLGAEFLLGLLATGWTPEQLPARYPGPTPEGLRAVFAFAAEVLHDEAVFALRPVAAQERSRAAGEGAVRFLADENVSAPLVAVLRAAGHDVAYVVGWGHEERRVVVTFDRGLGELLVRGEAPSPTLAWPLGARAPHRTAIGAWCFRRPPVALSAAALIGAPASGADAAGRVRRR